MKRSGFARRIYEPDQAAPLRPLERVPNYASISANDPAKADPKTVEHRNPHLLTMARGKPCLLRVPGICCGDWRTTVACHSNLSEHGKAGARKADDAYVVYGCLTCHRWLDQGPASREEKKAAFMRAHADQVLQWSRIVSDSAEKPKDRAAAHWALCHLNATSARREP